MGGSAAGSDTVTALSVTLSRVSPVKTRDGVEQDLLRDGVSTRTQKGRVHVVNEVLQWVAIGAVFVCVCLHTHPLYWIRRRK